MKPSFLLPVLMSALFLAPFAEARAPFTDAWSDYSSLWNQSEEREYFRNAHLRGEANQLRQKVKAKKEELQRKLKELKQRKETARTRGTDLNVLRDEYAQLRSQRDAIQDTIDHRKKILSNHHQYRKQAKSAHEQRQADESIRDTEDLIRAGEAQRDQLEGRFRSAEKAYFSRVIPVFEKEAEIRALVIQLGPSKTDQYDRDRVLRELSAEALERPKYAKIEKKGFQRFATFNRSDDMPLEYNGKDFGDSKDYFVQPVTDEERAQAGLEQTYHRAIAAAEVEAKQQIAKEFVQRLVGQGSLISRAKDVQVDDELRELIFEELDRELNGSMLERFLNWREDRQSREARSDSVRGPASQVREAAVLRGDPLFGGSSEGRLGESDGHQCGPAVSNELDPEIQRAIDDVQKLREKTREMIQGQRKGR